MDGHFPLESDGPSSKHFQPNAIFIIFSLEQNKLQYSQQN